MRHLQIVQFLLSDNWVIRGCADFQNSKINCRPLANEKTNSSRLVDPNLRLFRHSCVQQKSNWTMMPCWMFKCSVKFLWTCFLTYSERLRIDRRFSSSFHFFVLQKFYWYKNTFHRSSCTKDMKTVVQILISVIHWAFLKYLLNTVDELGYLDYRIKLCTRLIYKCSMVVEGREIYDIRFL